MIKTLISLTSVISIFSCVVVLAQSNQGGGGFEDRRNRILKIASDLRAVPPSIHIAAADSLIDVMTNTQDAVTQHFIFDALRMDWRLTDYSFRPVDTGFMIRVIRGVSQMKPADDGVQAKRIRFLSEAKDRSYPKVRDAATDVLCEIGVCSAREGGTQAHLIQEARRSWESFVQDRSETRVATIRMLTALQPESVEIQDARIEIIARGLNSMEGEKVRSAAAASLVRIAESEHDHETQKILLQRARPEWNHYEYDWSVSQHVKGNIDFLITLVRGIAAMSAVDNEIQLLKNSYLRSAVATKHPEVQRALSETLIDVASGVSYLRSCEQLFSTRR